MSSDEVPPTTGMTSDNGVTGEPVIGDNARGENNVAVGVTTDHAEPPTAAEGPTNPTTGEGSELAKGGESPAESEGPDTLPDMEVTEQVKRKSRRSILTMDYENQAQGDERYTPVHQNEGTTPADNNGRDTAENSPSDAEKGDSTKISKIPNTDQMEGQGPGLFTAGDIIASEIRTSRRLSQISPKNLDSSNDFLMGSTKNLNVEGSNVDGSNVLKKRKSRKSRRVSDLEPEELERRMTITKSITFLQDSLVESISTGELEKRLTKHDITLGTMEGLEHLRNERSQRFETFEERKVAEENVDAMGRASENLNGGSKDSVRSPITKMDSLQPTKRFVSSIVPNEHGLEGQDREDRFSLTSLTLGSQSATPLVRSQTLGSYSIGGSQALGSYSTVGGGHASQQNSETVGYQQHGDYSSQTGGYQQHGDHGSQHGQRGDYGHGFGVHGQSLRQSLGSIPLAPQNGSPNQQGQCQQGLSSTSEIQFNQISQPLHLEVHLARFEHKMRSLVSDLIRPSLQHSAQVDAKLKELEQNSKIHQDKFIKIQELCRNAIQASSVIGNFRETLERAEVNRREKEAAMKDEIRLWKEEIRKFELELEQKQTKISELRRNSDRQQLGINAITENTEKVRDALNKEISQTKKSIVESTTWFEMKLLETNTEIAKLVDQNFTSDRSVVKLASTVQQIESDLSETTGKLKNVERLKCDKEELRLEKERVDGNFRKLEKVLTKVEMEMESGFKKSEDSIELTRKLITENTQSTVNNIRNEFKIELERHEEARTQVLEALQKIDDAAVDNHRFTDLENLIDQRVQDIRNELKQIEFNHKREKGDREVIQEQILRKVRKAVEGNAVLTKEQRRVWQMLGTVSETLEISIALESQDETDRDGISLMCLKSQGGANGQGHTGNKEFYDRLESEKWIQPSHKSISSYHGGPKPYLEPTKEVSNKVMRIKTPGSNISPQKLMQCSPPCSRMHHSSQIVAAQSGGSGTAPGFDAIGGVKRKNQPVVSLDTRCVSCSGSSPHVLSAFKMACLQYLPSPVVFKNEVYKRKELLDIKQKLIEEAMCLANTQISGGGKYSNSGYDDVVIGGDDGYHDGDRYGDVSGDYYDCNITKSSYGNRKSTQTVSSCYSIREDGRPSNALQDDYEPIGAKKSQRAKKSRAKESESPIITHHPSISHTSSSGTKNGGATQSIVNGILHQSSSTVNGIRATVSPGNPTPSLRSSKDKGETNEMSNGNNRQTAATIEDTISPKKSFKIESEILERNNLN